MSEQLTVVCGQREDRNRRRVLATFGSFRHVDRFDVEQQFSRKKWRDAVIGKFGLDESSHEFLESEIIRSAEAADSTTELWQASVVSLSEVEPQQTTWLWDQYLPAGAIVVLDGDPGLGKSQLTVDLAARLSRGDSMPPQTAPDGTFDRRGTLILNAEDDPARTLRPRLDAAGADIGQIHLLREMAGYDGEESRPVSLPLDLPAIRAIIGERGIGLVVIDPFVAYLDSALSANSDADVRRCLGQVAQLAEETGTTMLLVRHLNKKSGLSAKYRGGGSIGITGAARAVFMVGEDPTESESRILAPVKTNLGPEPPSLRFHIESVETTSRVRWGDSCDVSASELLASDKNSQGGKLERAKAIMSEILSNGSRGSNEVMGACEAEGISGSTYHRARKALGVISEKTGFDDGQWMLSLPHKNGDSF